MINPIISSAALDGSGTGVPSGVRPLSGPQPNPPGIQNPDVVDVPPVELMPDPPLVPPVTIAPEVVLEVETDPPIAGGASCANTMVGVHSDAEAIPQTIAIDRNCLNMTA
jgi:hypothetical protein